ncbi:tyrosine-type recombinase/integrase [Candidatus Woesearchaeota archaeon]|nr:tyrosine-type recombinase/integrase [Candidatus Woesearchaeota archaeon]
MIKIQKDLFQEFETELRIRAYSPRTIESYLYETKRFFDFLSLGKAASEFQSSLLDEASRPVQSISQKDLKSYLAKLMAEKKLKPASIHLILSALKFFFREIAKRDIFEGIKMPKKQRKLPEILSKEEIVLLMEKIKNKKHRILIDLLYGSGLRVSEAVSLKISDIDQNQKINILKGGKGGKDRRIILSAKLRKSIDSYVKRRKDRNPYLFHSRTTHLTSRQAQRIVKKAAERAGIKRRVHCHMLRASFATHLLNAGVDIRKIQVLLGHEKISTTEIYTKVSTEGLENITSPMDKL